MVTDCSGGDDTGHVVKTWVPSDVYDAVSLLGNRVVYR